MSLYRTHPESFKGDPEEKDYRDAEMLSDAINSGNLDFMMSLMKDYNVNAHRWRDDPVLSEVVNYWEEGDTENNEKAKIMVDALLIEHTNINKPGWHSEKTPLHLATEQRKPTMVKLLLEKGANPNIRNYKDRTALHIATMTDNVEIYKDLLLAGADTTIEGLGNFEDNGRRFVADDFIKEEYKQQFEDVRKQVDTIKGVAAFNHIYPNPVSVYTDLQAEDIQNLHDYLGGIKRRKTIKRRKSIKRRKTIRRRKIIKRRVKKAKK